MKKWLILSIWGLMACLSAAAQNTIDDLVNEYSSVGNSRFVTAVTREPKTRVVQKVVKTLDIEGAQSSKLEKAFRQEAQKSSSDDVKLTFTERQSDDDVTLLLTKENRKQLRIYMFKREKSQGFSRKSRTTIIVKMK